MFDLLIRGASVVTPAGVVEADVAVDEGIIVAIGSQLDSGRAEHDAPGQHLFPGLIDAHVHFNEPGRTHWEGFATGSAALAAGGGTLYLDMPLNAYPPLLTAKDFQAKQAAAAASSVTDFAFWGGLTPDNLEHLEALAELGVVGFKAFMPTSGSPEFRAADDLTLFEGMQLAARVGLPVAVHAESEALIAALTRRLRAAGAKQQDDYLASRPKLAELEAVQRVLIFAEETGAEVHLVHLSTARAVALVSAAKARGVRVTCETCPHYLHFSAEDMDHLGAVLKCAPPLRKQPEQTQLIEAVRTGQVDFIASDHSPAPPELKSSEDFFEVWGGIMGVQATLGVLLQLALVPPHIASLTATRVATRFALKQKGRLEVGFDADFCLVDLARSRTLTKETLLTRHKSSPYLGQRLPGKITQTFVRGQEIFSNGAVCGSARGRLIKPDRAEQFTRD